MYASMTSQSDPRYQTVSSLMSLFVAALLHPEIQKRAQHDVDAVTGRERLPTFEDRPQLPFVDAVCREVLRWRPVVPLGEFFYQVVDLVLKRLYYPQPYLMQPQKIMSTMVSLYLKVGAMTY
jgi:hypothetical protein